MTTVAVEAGVKRRRRKRTQAQVVKYLALAFVALVVLLPVYVLLVASFKSGTEADPSRAWALPDAWSLDAWREAWNGEQYGLLPFLQNSLKLVIPATLISTVLGSLNGFVLSRWRFPGADLVFLFLLFGMFIPYQAVMIPLTQIFIDVGFPEGIPRLVFAHIVYGIPITTLIFRSYYATIPEDLIEAARMDRAGMLRTYWSVVLPLSAPAFVVTAIWQFTSIWNEFLFGLIITNEPRIRPITVALQNLSGSQYTQWNVQMAGALIVAMPTLLVYIFLGRYFLRGLLAGSLKG